jgi:hypothetical protein
MNGALVATHGASRVYFVVDPSGDASKTGALVNRAGMVVFVNFWAWVASNPDMEPIVENEFQEALWSRPLPQQEDAWNAAFVDRSLPLDKQTIDVANVVLLPSVAPKENKASLAGQVKVAQLLARRGGWS